MKLIYKKKRKEGKKKLKRLEKKLENGTNLDVRTGRWLNFYYPVGGDCYYVVGGQIIQRKNKKSSLNQKIRVRARLSRERSDIDMPLQLRHFSEAKS